MAIAGILVTGVRNDEAIIRHVLEAVSGVSRVQTTDDPAKLAAVVECPAQHMEATLQKLKDADGILNVDLAYINYEDELESPAC